MMLKRLLRFVLAIVVIVPALAQEPRIKTEGTPSLQIVSAPLKLDRKRRKVNLSLEVKNTGDKTIKGFGWEYGTQGVIRDYNVSYRSDMPEVSLLLTPNEKKKVSLLKDARVRDSFWDMPIREIRIVSVTFEDGSSWRRNKDD
jgi:hypothetical protein